MVIFHSYVAVYQRVIVSDLFGPNHPPTYMSFQMRICLSGICRSEKRQKPHEQFFTTETECLSAAKPLCENPPSHKDMDF
jgi:hypothetical protein